MSFDNAIRFAQDLIRIPSPPGGEGDVAARVAAELKALKFDDVFTDEVGNVIGIIKGSRTNGSVAGAANPAVMLSSHMDVVDIGDIATWEHPPFDAVIADDHLHGRGAMDIKGPLAIQTYAAAQFVEHRLECDVIIAHTIMEERGGWGMEHLMKSGAVKPGAVIIGESTNGDICVGHRGRAELIVDIIGLAGHASAPERARNPLDMMPRVLPAIHAFAATLTRVDPLLGRSTAVPTAVETLPRSRNVIPDIARIVIDWRVLPPMTADNAVEALRSHIDRNVTLDDGFTLDVRYSIEPQKTFTGRTRDRRMFTPGFVMDPNHSVVKTAVATVSHRANTTPGVRPWTFATDGGHTCGVHGIPTIGYAPGEERYAHTNRERLPLAQAKQTYEVYPHLIKAISDAIKES
jgi:putative selenium metabolism hydrolase